MFFNKRLCRAEAFSKTLGNMPKQKLIIMKLNKKKKKKNDNLESIVPKRIFSLQNRKNDYCYPEVATRGV